MQELLNRITIGPGATVPGLVIDQEPRDHMCLDLGGGKIVKLGLAVRAGDTAEFEEALGQPDTPEVVRQAIGYLLYAARFVFTSIVNSHPNLALRNEKLPFTLKNISISIDHTTSTLHLVYLSEDQKLRARTEHCISKLLSTRDNFTEPEQQKRWFEDWNAAQEQLAIIEKLIADRTAIEALYNIELMKMCRVGVRVL
jgi:hypothetical protein